MSQLIYIEELLNDITRYDAKIFIDTSSLLEPEIQQFWTEITPHIKPNKSPIFISYRVYEEVTKFASDPQACQGKQEKLHEQAKAVKRDLDTRAKRGLIQIRGEKDDANHADDLFIDILQKFHSTYHLILITQDNELAERASEIYKKERNMMLKVRRINQFGRLGPFRRLDVFTLKSGQARILPLTDKSINVPRKKDDYVYTITEEKIELGDQLKSGGEGVIYVVGNQDIAKIYRKITPTKEAKLQRMLEKPIQDPTICWPKALLFNEQKQCIGYLMKRVSDEAIPLAHLFSVKKDPQELIALSRRIIQEVMKLHRKGIVIGDLSDNNILLTPDHTLYFVDTDSYQIEDYACPVATPMYTAPEIRNCDFEKNLRKKTHDIFALSVLLFRIWLNGKPPYLLNSGHYGKEFCYEKMETEDSQWQDLYSPLRKAFHAYFSVKKEAHAPKEAKDWLEILKECYKEESQRSLPTSKSRSPINKSQKPTTTSVSHKQIAPNLSRIKEEEATCTICGSTVLMNKRETGNSSKIKCRNCSQ